jgi:hypothetical protein
MRSGNEVGNGDTNERPAPDFTVIPDVSLEEFSASAPD